MTGHVTITHPNQVITI